MPSTLIRWGCMTVKQHAEAERTRWETLRYMQRLDAALERGCDGNLPPLSEAEAVALFEGLPSIGELMKTS